ncbi:hypothetical protein FPQ18DRAFT_359065, partial [Pyronema domesticum]
FSQHWAALCRCNILYYLPPSPIIQDFPSTSFSPSGEPLHASPSFSFFCCCVRKPLIEGPQHSSVRSFVSAHDPMRRPRFPAAVHRRSAYYTSPSGEHHSPLLRRVKHSSARSVILVCDPVRWPHSPRDSAPALSSLQSCLRATTTCLAFAQCSALSQALLEGLPTLPRLPRRSPRLDRWMAIQIPPTSPEALGELTTTFWESARPPYHGGR